MHDSVSKLEFTLCTDVKKKIFISVAVCNLNTYNESKNQASQK